jgi:glycosyltransferase involved in cell wall biosynthesis
MKFISSNKLWINWENHRRSSELSKILGCKYFCFDYTGIKRYPLSILKTLVALVKHRPRILFVQNPSMILSALACFLKFFFKYYLVIDRHTTFRLNKPNKLSLRTYVFMVLHKYTIKTADLTIVTNEHLAKIVKSCDGEAFVLPDKLPEFFPIAKLTLKSSFNLMLPSSFGNDEPICEVLQALEKLSRQVDIQLYITGNLRNAHQDLLTNAPANVYFTGYLPDQNYVDLLHSVDGVMALTTSDFCMLCGCYEAVSAKKPLITSNKTVLRNYFSKAIFVENDKDSIIDGILFLKDNFPFMVANAQSMYLSIAENWGMRHSKLIDTITKSL